VLADREVSPQLGLLKSTLLQLDSTFSERDYGASTFRDFIEKIAKTGIITLRHSGRSMLVDAADGVTEAGDSQTTSSAMVTTPDTAAVETVSPAPSASALAASVVRDPEQVRQIITQTKDLFNRASQPPRWPMYVRQIKQYLRSADPNFDEHKWGFATIMEFLRVCQREGLLRLERDRRGQIRVFPGSALPQASATAPAFAQREDETRDMEPRLESVETVAETNPSETFEAIAPVSAELDETAPQFAPAKPRRVRKSPSMSRVAAARKPAQPRSGSRRRKPQVPV